MASMAKTDRTMLMPPPQRSNMRLFVRAARPILPVAITAVLIFTAVTLLGSTSVCYFQISSAASGTR